MAVVQLTDHLVGSRNQRIIGYLDVASQTSTNAVALVADSEFDSREWDFIAIEILVATNSIKWFLRGSNDPAFANYQNVISGGTAAAGTHGTSINRLGGYNHAAAAGAIAEYDYYYLAIQSDVVDTHGSATIKVRGWRI